MSASTIARWNAIPLERSEQPESLKRNSRDDDDDDNVSLVSRTPSPPPEGMDVDAQDISKYDEYVRGPAREVITVETKIKPTNKGFAMLAKLGWTEGTPLGLSGDGRVDPIPFQMKSDSTGLGKVNQDVRMIESTVSQRRELDSERQQKESDEQRQAREDAVARREAVASELSDVLKPFYCSLCDKQFKNVAQYDEHCNSYAHHHKARFKDMQASARMKPQEEINKRKEKERKREERELRKIAAASGIKVAKTATVPASVASSSTTTAPALATTDDSSTGTKSSAGWATVSGSGDSAQSSFKKSGWATVGASSSQSTQVLDAPKSSSGGWATVSSSAEGSKPSSSSTGPAFRTGVDFKSTAVVLWLATVSSAEAPELVAKLPSAGAPAFRAGGWSSLDTQSDPSNPLPSSGSSSSQPPPPSKGGWKTVSTPAFNGLANSGNTSSAQDTMNAPPVNPPPAPTNGGWKAASSPAAPQDTATTAAAASRPPSKAHVGRVGWQQFQKSNSRRK
ncbi:hypothetical protein D9758_002377 [Tetrapyrgos nigripes]|uniref:G-patch domain-containing protein n=1 Tax=Tetrapyrgos nigripes TaxID=182062 RepID=A0A8H5GP85_9AGAR|nr:hypothetical protein D9758_002377 [Tetrapyrgos nigripes]